jgi:hypothetical protein
MAKDILSKGISSREADAYLRYIGREVRREFLELPPGLLVIVNIDI